MMDRRLADGLLALIESARGAGASHEHRRAAAALENVCRGRRASRIEREGLEYVLRALVGAEERRRVVVGINTQEFSREIDRCLRDGGTGSDVLNLLTTRMQAV